MELIRFAQVATESVDSFVTRCKEQAAKCRLHTTEQSDERIIETIIAGIKYSEVQKDLLGKDETLTLAQAVDISRRHEASDLHMERFQNLNSEAGSNIAGVTKSRKCRKCWKYHPVKPREACPAHKSKCGACGKVGHWQAMCFFKSDDDDSRSNDSRESHGYKNDDSSRKSYGYKKRNRKKRHKRRVQAVREQQESSSDESVSVVSGFQSFSFETIDVCGIKEAHNRDEIIIRESQYQA